MRHPGLLLAVSLLAATLSPRTARAQWSATTTVDNMVCNALGAQTAPAIVPDGSGGFIAAWIDRRIGTRYDIYAQRFDADGYAQWAANGILADTTTGSLAKIVACPDDSGGVILAWYRTSGTTTNRIMAQRIDRFGQARWGIGGVRISLAEVSQQLPNIVRDQSGGGIVVYTHNGGTIAANVYGQRLDRNGARLWGASGDSLAERGEIRTLVAAERPGGGVYFGFWRTYGVISAFGVDGNANSLWAHWDSITTVPMATSPPGIGVTTTTDGAVFWSGDGTKLVARKFGDNGAVWSSSRWVATHAYGKSVPQICSDNAGGAILAWRDGQPAAVFTAYLQRMLADGTPAWGVNGVPAGTTIWLNGGGLEICPDDANGAWIVTSGYPGIWAQHFSGAGVPWLPAGGVGVSETQMSMSYNGGELLPGKDASHTLVWQDPGVPTTSIDIRARHFSAFGTPGTTDAAPPAAPATLALAVGPNPAGGRTTLRFTLPQADDVTLEVFGLRGERVATLAQGALPPGAHARDLALDGLAPGVYLARLVTARGTATARIAHVR